MLVVLLCLALALQNPESETPADPIQEARAVLASVDGRRASDLEGARDDVAGIVDRLLDEEHGEANEEVTAVLVDAGVAALQLGDPATAVRALEEASARLAATLPPEDGELLRVLHYHARALQARGDLPGARALHERVVAGYAATRPAEDPELLNARQSLATTLHASGDFEGARAVFEEILEVRSRTLAPEHPDLQKALANAAVLSQTLGDLERARELQERVLEIRERTLPEDARDLQSVRISLAVTVYMSGEPERANELVSAAVAALERTAPEDDRLLARGRVILAVTLKETGRLEAARELEEKVLALRERTLPEEHPDVQNARTNLAVTLLDMGDLAGARELQEAVLEAYEGRLEDSHEYLAVARANLALTLEALGDDARAAELLEEVLAARLPLLGDDHLEILRTRANLAVTCKGLGNYPRARELEEQVLATRLRTLPADHKDTQVTRMNLANTLTQLGEWERALELHEAALAVFESTLPDHDEAVRLSRTNVAWARTRADDAQGVASMAVALGSAVRGALREAAFTRSPREASERAAWLAVDTSHLLAFAAGAGRLPADDQVLHEAFATVEMVRSAELIGPAFAALSPEPAELDALRAECRRASEKLVELVRSGADRDGLREARRARDAAWEQLVGRFEGLPGARHALTELTPEGLAAQIAPGVVLVGYWRYTAMALSPDESRASTGRSDRLLAFVITGDGKLRRVELGPLDAIEEGVAEWRRAVDGGVSVRGVEVDASSGGPDSSSEPGERLRRLVVDPVLASIEDPPGTLIVALDDVLHALPLDALPFEDGVLGDRLHVEVRCSLWELLLPEREDDQLGTLVALGGVDYDDREHLAESPAGTLRSAPSRDAANVFQALPATREEIVELGELWSEWTPREAQLLLGGDASRAALTRSAREASYLHLATHGWFSPELATPDRATATRGADAAPGVAMTRAERVRELSPLVLCGLALAGANREADAPGAGSLTAEELATLDLSGCELAVLSACETARGELRSGGQGVASLQKALHMAGARSVVTSLWKVPDDATRELMVAFYRAMWIDGQPRARALWHAKRHVRELRDAAGEPAYTTRDWAAWVLTGEPD